MADEKDPSDYEVGYGRPPRHSRFQRGKSGNPKGRPKAAKALRSDLMAELGEKITLREGDKVIRISKQRAMVKSMVTAGIKGNQRATAQTLSMLMQIVGPGEDIRPEVDLSAEDQEILADFLRRNSKGEQS